MVCDHTPIFTSVANILQRKPHGRWRCVCFIATKNYEVCLVNGSTRSVYVMGLFECCVFSMNGQLEQLEEENNILSRWKPHDKEYEEVRTELLRRYYRLVQPCGLP